MGDFTLIKDKTFFFPNCCHVCKRYDLPLITCNKCWMISYCNKDHQLQHWPQHQEICAAIRLVLGDKKYMNTDEISAKQWTKIRFDYFTKVSKELKRNMKRDELHMFMYTKACVACYRQDDILRCIQCPSTSICTKHMSMVKHTEKYCKLMRQSFELWLKYASIHVLEKPYLTDFSYETPFHDMNSFIDTYVSLDKNDIYLRMLHSNVVTYPLTVYFCLAQLNQLRCKTLNLHIIGINITDRAQIEMWRMLLILIPTLTTLRIWFLRLQGESGIHDGSTHFEYVTVQTLRAYVSSMSYKEYINSSDFKSPHFIFGFHATVIHDTHENANNVDISERYGSAESGTMCPVILLFDKLHQADKVVLNKIKNSVCLKNPYKDLLPNRDFLKEGILHFNSYIIILYRLTYFVNVFVNRRNRCCLYLRTTQE